MEVLGGKILTVATPGVRYPDGKEEKNVVHTSRGPPTMNSSSKPGGKETKIGKRSS